MNARNIEIKAWVNDFDKQYKIAERLGDGPGVRMIQEDTFFNVRKGRLKLREFDNGTGELIQYQRTDSFGPTQSTYIRSTTDEPTTLKEALANALGIRAVVRKTRTVFLVGRTRIHLDRVEELGGFLELEVVLDPHEEADQGVKIAQRLMKQLGIQEVDLVKSAYVDLLEGSSSR